ncbi:MAG: hypothetical protein GXP27_00670 [Planctomycetes bacterium]|nr:hypothetical protein [Planctomycetota bacterium]
MGDSPAHASIPENINTNTPIAGALQPKKWKTAVRRKTIPTTDGRFFIRSSFCEWDRGHLRVPIVAHPFLAFQVLRSDASGGRSPGLMPIACQPLPR